jgi:hypothetical protein
MGVHERQSLGDLKYLIFVDRVFCFAEVIVQVRITQLEDKEDLPLVKV